MTRSYRAGLIVLSLLALVDLSTPLTTDGSHPPMSIALIGAGLGLASVVLAVLAWRGRPWAAVGLVVIRVLSALSAVPAFFEPGVPGAAMIAAGIGIVFTLVGVGLVLAGIRRPAVVGVA